MLSITLLTTLKAQLLFELQLRRCPPLDVVIEHCASAESRKRDTAFNYLLDNMEEFYNHYDPKDFGNVAFIPAMDCGILRMCSPNEVFNPNIFRQHAN